MCIGFVMIVILLSRVQMTLLLGDITSALASADAERVAFEEQLNSFKVLHFITHLSPAINHSDNMH